jgi:hypothetical protein
MIEAALTALVIVLTPVAWLSTGILFAGAARKPRIGALTERAAIALDISLFVTSALVLRVNTYTEFSLFPVEAARLLFLISSLGIAVLPLAWLYLFFSNRLGE